MRQAGVVAPSTVPVTMTWESSVRPCQPLSVWERTLPVAGDLSWTTAMAAVTLSVGSQQ